MTQRQISASTGANLHSISTYKIMAPSHKKHSQAQVKTPCTPKSATNNDSGHPRQAKTPRTQLNGHVCQILLTSVLAHKPYIQPHKQVAATWAKISNDLKEKSPPLKAWENNHTKPCQSLILLIASMTRPAPLSHSEMTHSPSTISMLNCVLCPSSVASDLSSKSLQPTSSLRHTRKNDC